MIDPEVDGLALEDVAVRPVPSEHEVLFDVTGHSCVGV